MSIHPDQRSDHGPHKHRILAPAAGARPPQARDPRLARLRRRSRSCSAAPSAPRTLADEDTRQRRVPRRRAASPTPTSQGRPTSRCSCRARTARRPRDPQFRAAVSDVGAAARRRAHVSGGRVAARRDNEDQISPTAARRWFTFELRGDDEQMARSASTRRSPRPPRRSGAHPELRDRAVRRRQRRQGARRRPSTRTSSRPSSLSLPITLLILVVAFGALVAAGVPLLLGAHRGDRRRSGWSAPSASSSRSTSDLAR